MSANDKIINHYQSYSYIAKDITVILCVRIMEENDWLLGRLVALKGWYEPEPNFLVIDYGSKSVYQERIKRICTDKAYKYHFVESDGVFSLSEARNAGFSISSSELLFFTDPDFFMERDSFSRFVNIVNGHDFSKNKLTRITMPAYHVIESESKRFEISDIKGRESLISQWGFQGPYAENKVVFDFIAPYSNNFLCHRDLYDLTGGYCMDFRGHGSEDFEFMVRQNLLFGNMPMPDHLIEDKYKPFPFREDYFDWKKYSGFRRLAEAEAFSGEIAGLRAFHIWHPLTVKGWHEVNDGKRITFNKVLSRYLGNELNLLKEDFLSRDKSALCLSDNVSDTGYFLPLRLLGYKLDVLNSKEIIDQTGSNNEIEDKTYDAVFIISLKDKLKFHSLLKQYFQRGISVFVLSEGVIPGSIFFKNLSENTLNFPRTDLVQTEANISSFESFLTYLNDMYKQDNKLLAALIRDESTKVFILIDETEAFYFQKEKSEQFKLYLEELNHLIDEKTEVMFVFWEETVKNLIPFLDVDNLPRNCYAVGSDVHSSSIVRLADVVVSYGAEEGFLGLFLGKPVYFISQSDYAYSIVSVSGLSEALESHEVSGHDSKISKEKMSSLFYWFFSKKYSFYFKSASVWQEQQVIESSFQRVKCSFLNFEGWKKLISSENLKYNYHKSSYLASKLGLYGEEVEISKRKVLVNSLTEKNIRMSKELLDSKIAIQGLVEEGNKFKKKAIGVQQLLLRKEKSLCSLVEEMKIAENQKIKNEEQLSEYEHENRNLIQKCEETQKIIVDTQEKLINLQKDKDEALSMVLEYEKSLSNLEQEKAEKISILQRIGVMSYLFLVWPFMTKRLRLKLYKKPRAFFKDSKHSIAQSVGRYLKLL